MAMTPMMKQFADIKKQYPDALLLFRCGDFYETYQQDAIKAAKILNITLTHRNNGAGQADTEMAGFPYHALDNYLPKLVRAGLRVAVCDQLEDPKLAKGLVQRGVTELVTPGVSYSDTTLTAKENNFVASVFLPHNPSKIGQKTGVSFLDISTGEFLLAEGSNDYIDKLLVNFSPKEVLYERGKKQEFVSLFGNKYFTFELEDWMMTYEAASEKLINQFSTNSLKGFGVERMPNGIIAAGSILHYLAMTQHNETSHIRHLSRIEEEKYVWLDRFTIRNLELFPKSEDDQSSLFKVLDHTISPMGGRTLRRWLSFPLKDVEPINQRLEVTDFFYRNASLSVDVVAQISNIQDLERLASKIATGRINPKEVYHIYEALQAVAQIKNKLTNSNCAYLDSLMNSLSVCSQLAKRIKHTISPDAPALLSKPGYINSGVDKELDELRNLHTDSRAFLLTLQQREAEQTGIQSLKIGFNNVFGYYLEVRNTYKDLVPANWVRRQTLAQAERYVTEELNQYEEKIRGAEEKIGIIENRIFYELLAEMSGYVSELLQDAHIVGTVDCLLSFAQVAQQNKYVKPTVDDSFDLDIKAGRHPVIEQHLKQGEKYISNDISLNKTSQQIIILTGPNMAGKSALLRQTALITLMAQMGCFVPADEARVGVVDKIFTRVGASDNISGGESTFMVEMNEAAAILNNLSERSLVVFDELGRGTSTYDGISIAWAIVEYLHKHKTRAKTLFATHYHELNEMEKSFDRICNFSISVREMNDKIIFLRKLQRGGSEHSFGIHVAQMAGLPPDIVKRAQKVLKNLENANKNAGALEKVSPKMPTQDNLQLSFFGINDPLLERVRDELMELDVNSLTPLEALIKLSEVKKLIENK